ncbi:hypothetical protein PYW07_001467 [Mythimna separata]|uniref:Uncharacterized protein n=1 Tax=Mythimna separata TaxID=271217 RepID=A0AAD7YTN1_MYTSE|nr:hypothetical protein PYW07_001467 [Mythimna separata]
MFADSDDSEEEPQPRPRRNSSSESSYDETEEEKKTPVPEEKQHETLVQAVKTEEEGETKMSQIPQPSLRRKRFIPNYEVDGVYRVTLGEKTQIHTETVVGTHVYAQYPWKLVSKAKIMESIDMGGELSEFFPLRDQLEAYSDKEVLIGYILDESTNTDDFYICCTAEARNHCKEQSDKFIKRQEKKLEKSVYKRPKPWKSLGSDAEIMELVPVNNRDLIEIEIKTKFPMKYEPDKFDVRDTCSVRDGSIELISNKEDYLNVFRRRVDCASQITPTFQDRTAQTQLTYPKNMWTQSIADALGQVEDIEGGGDASLAPTIVDDGDKSSVAEIKVQKQTLDEAELATYKAARTRMRRPSYVQKMNSFVTSRQCEMESVIKLNVAMDMYYNDYSNLANKIHTDSLGTMSFEEYVCFTDVRAKDNYKSRMEAMIERELKVMRSFTTWQEDFVKKNPDVLLELKRKEDLLFAEKEEEKRKEKEDMDKQLVVENEALRLEKLKILGPEEKWQKIIQKLIERTIAVKKRINKALLIEHEKPLRELETQRLEKERRMLEIMKSQKAIFTDTVAILFPEATAKEQAPKKSIFAENKEAIKRQYLKEYEYLRKTASIMVKKNPYYRDFKWESTLAEGKERRAALNADEDIVKMHYARIEEEHRESISGYVVTEEESQTREEVEEEEKKVEFEL